MIVNVLNLLYIAASLLVDGVVIEESNGVRIPLDNVFFEDGNIPSQAAGVEESVPMNNSTCIVMQCTNALAQCVNFGFGAELKENHLDLDFFICVWIMGADDRCRQCLLSLDVPDSCYHTMANAIPSADETGTSSVDQSPAVVTTLSPTTSTLETKENSTEKSLEDGEEETREEDQHKKKGKKHIFGSSKWWLKTALIALLFTCVGVSILYCLNGRGSRRQSNQNVPFTVDKKNHYHRVMETAGMTPGTNFV